MDQHSPSYIQEAIATTQGKTRVLSDLVNYAGFYFVEDDDIEYDPEAAAKHLVQGNLEGAQNIRAAFDQLETFDSESVQGVFKQTAESMGIKVRGLVHPIRIACTGKTAGPSLYHLIAILGKETVLKRIDRMILSITTKE